MIKTQYFTYPSSFDNIPYQFGAIGSNNPSVVRKTHRPKRPPVNKWRLRLQHRPEIPNERDQSALADSILVIPPALRLLGFGFASLIFGQEFAELFEFGAGEGGVHFCAKVV